MKLEKALDIISRIDAITEETSEDEIFNIIDDTYYLLAVECKTKLDDMKKHIDDIVVSYNEEDTEQSSNASTTQTPKKQIKQSAPSTSPIYEEDAEMMEDIPLHKKEESSSTNKRSSAKKSTTQKRQLVNTDYSSLFD